MTAPIRRTGLGYGRADDREQFAAGRLRPLFRASGQSSGAVPARSAEIRQVVETWTIGVGATGVGATGVRATGVRATGVRA